MMAFNRNQVGCWGDYEMTPPHDPTPLKPSNGAVLGGVHGAHAVTPLKASKYAAGAGVIFRPLRGRSGVTPPRSGDGAERLHPSSCYQTRPPVGAPSWRATNTDDGNRALCSHAGYPIGGCDSFTAWPGALGAVSSATPETWPLSC